MHEGARTGGVIHSARTVGGGAGLHVTAAEQRSPHMIPQRRVGPCTRYRSAALPPDVTARGNVKRFVSGRRGLALPGLSFRG